MKSPGFSARFKHLPGWELVEEGLADLAAGRTTPSSCAVWLAARRLKKVGAWDATSLTPPPGDLESMLYRLLGQEPGDAHSKYNSMLRRLRRLEHALDRELFRTDPAGAEGG